MLTLYVFAQSNNAEQQLFNESLEAYNAGNYQASQNGFFRLLQQYPEGRLLTATRLLLAKSYYKLGDYSRAEVICKFFFNRHDNSNYLDDMHHLLGNIYFKRRQYTLAIDEWVWVIQNSNDPRLKRTDEEYLYNTMDYFLSRSQIEGLQKQYQNAEVDGLASIVLAKKLIQQGERNSGQAMLRDFLQEQPNHLYADEARRLLGGGPVTGGRVASGGFIYLKPVKGDEKEIADEIELGLQYAFLEYRQRNPSQGTSLRSVEFEPTVLGALETASREILDADPLCIIGPVDSDQCAALSLLSRYEKRPFIIPLSSQAGLTRLSSYAFQINPDVRTKGRFLSNYAIRELAAKRMAILAPADEYGEGFVQSFMETAQANGGQILTVQWYYDNTTDLTRQFRALRREGFYATFLDSLARQDSSFTEGELKRRFRSFMDELYTPPEGMRIDTTDVPSTGIDALLIILTTPDLIQYVAPQLAFYNIQTTVLGNEGWNDAEQLQKYREHLEGLIYITAGYYDPNSWEYREFLNRFRNDMRATPELFHLLGYDIMRWLLANFQPGMSQETFQNQLQNTTQYQGMLENIDFSNSPRINGKLNVLKLKLGQIIKLN